MRVLIGVCATFSATHRDATRTEYHGHSYRVRAWFEAGDAVDLQNAVRRDVATHYDHKTLPDELTRSEAIGAAIIGRLGCVGVEVDRPLEGICVKVGVTA